MEGYIYKIFKKSYDEILLSDIEDFFSEPQEETGVLEFKSGDVSLEDTFREVAAFLNTEGGLIIIGAPKKQEERINQNQIKEIYQGDITFSKFRNKDWLYQKLASNVIPTSTSISIKEFLVPDKGGIFLIDVPQSDTPPHQVESEGKYYIRMDRIAKPAPHGLIQSLFDKRRKPRLEVNFEVEPKLPEGFLLNININNTSNLPADKVGFIIELFNAETRAARFSRKIDFFPLCYSYSDNYQGVLVRNVSIKTELFITHKFKEFLIRVSYWSKELDFNFDYYLFNTENYMENKNSLIKAQRDFSIPENESLRLVDEIIKALH